MKNYYKHLESGHWTLGLGFTPLEEWYLIPSIMADLFLPKESYSRYSNSYIAAGIVFLCFTISFRFSWRRG